MSELRRGRDWGLLLVEVVLIVASILLAFSLESWREDRQEERRQVEVRETVRSDFETLLPRLLTQITAGDTLVARTDRLLSGLASPSTAGADSLKVLFDATLRPVGRVPVPPSYRAAMSSGELRTLDDPELMDALARLEYGDQMLAEHMRVSADIFYTGLQAEVSARVGGTRVLMGADTGRRPPSDAEYIALVSGLDVYAATERMYIVNRNVLNGLRFLRTAMEDAVEALSR